MPQGSISIQPRQVNAKLVILDIEGELTGGGEQALMPVHPQTSFLSTGTAIEIHARDQTVQNHSGRMMPSKRPEQPPDTDYKFAA